METLEMIIRFWQDTLNSNRFLLEPSVEFFIEQTIKSLKECQQLKGGQK